MDSKIPEFHEALERQLGRNFSNFQVFSYRPQGHLHDECDRITEFHLSEAEPSEKRISERYSPFKSLVSGYFRGYKKMDNYHPGLGTGLWRAEHHV